jgi:maltoporin
MNPPGVKTLVLTACFAICSSALTRAADSDLEKLKEQLKGEIDAQTKAIQDKYEQRIQELEKRIKALEEDNERLKRAASTSAVPATAEIQEIKKQITELEEITGQPSPEALAALKRARANADAIKSIEMKLQSDATETRDIYREDGGWPFDITKFYDLPMPFEFHGYLRSGFGMNGNGGKMEAFKAPGAAAKYRLGNEADTYGEASLTHNWLRQDEPLKAPYVRTTVTLSYSTENNFSYDSLNNQAQGNDFALREAYVEAGNVLANAPEVRFWAGQRFYRRHDIHINDFFYLDMSGYGGGVQDIPVGEFGKIAIAWLGGSVDNYQVPSGSAAKQNVDLRLYNLKAPFGHLTFWFDYSYTKGGDVNNVANPDGSPLHIESSSGWAVGIIHRTPGEELLGGYNEFSVQYGAGAAYNFASTLDSSGPHLNDASRFRVTDQFTIQPSPHYAMQLIGLYEDTYFGGPDSRDWWASTGVRPIYFFNDRFSIALETGIDWAKSEPLGTQGNLWKITLAPQLQRGGKFFSRPVIRPFVTYAQWTEGFKGQIGGNAYENATVGWSYGIQAEAWW